MRHLPAEHGGVSVVYSPPNDRFRRNLAVSAGVNEGPRRQARPAAETHRPPEARGSGPLRERRTDDRDRAQLQRPT